MIEKQLQRIKLRAIDVDDDIYRISSAPKNEKLYESIQEIGLVNPIVVQAKESGYRIVCGFQRLLALMDLKVEEAEAFVLQGFEPSLCIFWYAVQDNRTIRHLDAIEVSRIIYTLQQRFAIPETKIIQHYLPQLGFGKNPKIYALYKDLHLLSPRWQQMVSSEQTPIDVANDILKRPGPEQEVLYEIYSNLRLGKNRQREFLLLLSDVARIQNIGLMQLFEQQDVKSILAENKTTPSQKAEQLKVWLWEKRYPSYVKAKQQYDHILREAKCPRDIDIQAPPYFEGEEFRITFSFSSEKKYFDRLSALQMLLENQTIQKLLSLL